jgi:hypothetical protein
MEGALMRKRTPLLVVALVCAASVVGGAAGALVAGGGGGRSTSTAAHPTTVTVVRTGSGETAPPAPPPAAEQGGAAATPNVTHGVAACVNSLEGHVTLTGSAIARLEAICARVMSGNQAVHAEALREACVELVNNLQISAGRARAHALAICAAPLLR